MTDPTEVANSSSHVGMLYDQNDLRQHLVQDHVNSTIKTAVMVIYLIVVVVGIFGNMLTILSIFLNKKLRSIPNVYICNLAFADFIVCGLISTYSAYLLTIDPSTVSPFACQFIGALTTGLLAKTMLGLTAIAINRYILLVKGSQLYTRLYTRRNVIISVAMLWILPVLMVAPGLLGFGQYGYNTKMGTCIFIAHDKMTYIFVQAILHGVCVGPCVMVTMFCYISIIIYFRRTQVRLQLSIKHPRATSSTSNSTTKSGSTGTEYTTQDSSSKVEDYELSSSGPSSNNNNSNPSPVSHHTHAAKRNRASRRVVANLCTVFMVFLLCWMPIVGVFTIDYNNTYPAAVYHIFFCFAVCNSCMNVFIYAGMNRAFRRSYSRLLRCQCSKINSAF